MAKIKWFALAAVLLSPLIWNFTHKSTPLTASPSASSLVSKRATVATGPSAPRTQAIESARQPASVVRVDSAMALEQLNRDSQQPWTVVSSPQSGRLKTLYGGQMPFGVNALDKGSEKFLDQFSLNLFGVKKEDLRLGRTVQTDRTKIIYDQFANGIPVYGGTLALVFENATLTRVQNDLSASPPEAATPSLTTEQAIAAIESPHSDRTGIVVKAPGLEPSLIYYPTTNALVLAYKMYVDDTTTDSRFLKIVGANSGRVLLSTSVQVK